MRLSTLVTFMLPLSALAAPAFVKRSNQYDYDSKKPSSYDHDRKRPSSYDYDRNKPSQYHYQKRDSNQYYGTQYDGNDSTQPDLPSQDGGNGPTQFVKRANQYDEKHYRSKNYSPSYDNYDKKGYGDKKTSPHYDNHDKEGYGSKNPSQYGYKKRDDGTQYDRNVDKYNDWVHKSKDSMNRAYQYASNMDELKGSIKKYNYEQAIDNMALDRQMGQLKENKKPQLQVYVGYPH